jgi:hypothetical protein
MPLMVLAAQRHRFLLQKFLKRFDPDDQAEFVEASLNCLEATADPSSASAAGFRATGAADARISFFTALLLVVEPRAYGQGNNAPSDLHHRPGYPPLPVR